MQIKTFSYLIALWERIGNHFEQRAIVKEEIHQQDADAVDADP